MDETVELPENFSNLIETIEQPQQQNYFLTKTFGEWYTNAKNKPKQHQLLGDLILENELYIVFGTTNVGKSLFGVQAALHIAGVSTCSPFDPIDRPRKVLYCDFELQDFQFAKRLINDDIFEQFKDLLNNENLIRAEQNPDFIDSLTDAQLTSKTNYTDMIFDQLENVILSNKVDVVLFDNITFIGEELENSKNAAPLIKRFKLLGRKHKVTFIIFGHTPKLDAKMPLTSNSLAGSSQLAAIVDGLIAIGKVAKDETVYLKELKVRSKEKTYTADNVMRFEIVRTPEAIPQVKYKFIEYAEESELLKDDSKAEKELRDKQIIELINEGNSYAQVADILKISKGLISKVAKKHKKNDNKREHVNTN